MDNFDILLIASLFLFFLFSMLQFTNNPKKYLWILYYLIFIEYIAALFYFGVVNRTIQESPIIQTDLFWGYDNPSENIIKDNIINILIFVPIGVLVSIISKKFMVLKALLTGLFVSETIECCQLIFKRGNFDIDDLFNNTIGSFIGSLFYLIILNLCRLLKEHKI